MLSKLVKNDLKKNMRLLLILYVATIVVAGIITVIGASFFAGLY